MDSPAEQAHALLQMDEAVASEVLELLCCDDTQSDRRPPSKPTTHTKHPQQHKNCDASYTDRVVRVYQ